MEILKKLIDIVMTITPILPYYAQIGEFKKNKSSKGFSIKISLFILCANILRIFFWFGEKFNKSLLIQSFLMILIQFYLIITYIKFSEKNSKKKIKFLENFWDWDFIENYFIFIGIFIFSFFFLCMMFGFQNKFYMNLLGSISSFLEAIMPCAQILKIFKEKSSANFSDVIIISWVLGDAFKACYFKETGLPIQFIISGFMQVFFDFIIILQIVYYDFLYLSREIK
jgi:hypothetical protein